MLISWLGWSVSGIPNCLVIFPEKDPVMEDMPSPFLSLVGWICLVNRADCDPLLPPLSRSRFAHILKMRQRGKSATPTLAERADIHTLKVILK